MKKKYKVGGMACGGCVANVKRALESLPEVESVKVDLATAVAEVEGDVTPEVVEDAIENAGFDYIGEA